MATTRGFAVWVALALAGALVAGAVLLGDHGGRGGGSSSRAVVSEVIDGDTLVIASGEHVRLIGVDTPERGACGYDSATRALRRLAAGREVVLVDPAGVQDRDRFDRLLRFVEVGGRDAGFVLIQAGLARARFDSRDGLDPHPREDRYHDADANRRGPCE